MRALSHEPYGVFPRRTFAGEQSFYTEWQKIADKEFCDIINRCNSHCDCLDGQACVELIDYEEINQQSRLVASFMCWLGTNCGRSFIDTANSYTTKLGYIVAGYIAAWAVENLRSGSLNSGWRTIEHFVKNEHINLTQEDYELIEECVKWLSNHEGQEFIKCAENGIKHLQEQINTYEILCKN
jgi:hypothetical protein